jgi:hypothetical protein
MNEMTVPEALELLREGKRQLRTSRRNLTLAQKVEQVVELQRVVLPLIRRRRGLKPWERVWELHASPLDR